MKTYRLSQVEAFGALRNHSSAGVKSASRAAAATKEISLKIRYVPIVFFQIYLALTVFLFVFGPWHWPIVNGLKLYVFLALAHLALFLGYRSVIHREPTVYSGKWKIERIVLVALIAHLLLLIPTSSFRSGSALPDVFGGLADPGLAYETSNRFRSEGGGSAEYIRIVLGPLLFLLLPLTVLYWHRLKVLVKALSAFAIFGFLAIYLAIGTNKALADFVLLTPCLIFAGYMTGALRLNRTFKIVAIAFSTLAFILFITFFSSTMVSRMKGESQVSSFGRLGISADSDNFLVRDLPEKQRPAVIALTSYLTQGYYAVYLALDEPFVPMFGVGNSLFLSHNAARITGNDEIEWMPYPMRLSRWDGWGNWSTIYPWIASDVSFPGTIVVVFLIGRFFGLAWLDTIEGSNPFAVGVFAQFLIMLFYFSANNQALQTGEALSSFVGVFALWLFTRKRIAPITA
ncbi:MAG TPA: hypothetical protein VK557_07270 [Pyrinomonadaceae bacterium]|nr:hypothetical protein [Pyrinomonadaceae bacterium]